MGGPVTYMEDILKTFLGVIEDVFKQERCQLSIHMVWDMSGMWAFMKCGFYRTEVRSNTAVS